MLTELATMVGAAGGLTALASLGAWWVRRRSDARKADTEADRDEFSLLKERIEYDETQNLDLTKRNRELSDRLLEKEHEISDLRVELAHVRCDDQPCPWRDPANANTPMMPEAERDAWMARHRCAECPKRDCEHRKG